MTCRALARRYDTGELVSVEWKGPQVVSLRPLASPPGAGLSIERIPYVAPGFVDLQINGYGGREYCSPTLTIEDVLAIDQAIARDGITAYCPTVTTHSFDVLRHAVGVLAEACQQDAGLAQRILGIHLEGPYISAEDGPRGAHPRPFCRPPDWQEFCRLQEHAQGLIRIVTLSPEYPQSIAFIERLACEGILVAIGHTAASVEQIRDAIAAGARLSTHLGNGCHLVLPRHPNYLWEQLADDRLTASLIVDGHHLPPSVVRCFVRCKGPQRCILVSDITGLGGMPAGQYQTPLGAVEILDDGRLVVAGQRSLLAGAARPIGDGVVNLMRFAGLDLATAVEMASRGPMRLLGRPDPQLHTGARADLVFFLLRPDHAPPLTVVGTVRTGTLAYGPAGDWLVASESRGSSAS
jgi:N-acetylglucosamine-6-phosphate deacetylase